MIFLKGHKDNLTIKDVTSQQSDGYLTGQLLVATPLIEGAPFGKSVILVCDHNKNGGMGLIINHHLINIDQEDLFKRLGFEKPHDYERQLEVYFGGPVDTTRGFVVHTDEYDTQNTIKLGNGIAITSEQQILKDFTRGKGPEQLMLVMGYSGWVGGQIEKEIEENSWLTVPADRELVFETHDDSKWQKSAFKYGIDINKINMISGSA